MDYDWDEAKRVLNRRKHGDFMDAIAALEDPNRLEEAGVPVWGRAEQGHRHGAWQRSVRRHYTSRRNDLQDHLGPEGYVT